LAFLIRSYILNRPESEEKRSCGPGWIAGSRDGLSLEDIHCDDPMVRVFSVLPVWRNKTDAREMGTIPRTAARQQIQLFKGRMSANEEIGQRRRPASAGTTIHHESLPRQKGIFPRDIPPLEHTFRQGVLRFFNRREVDGDFCIDNGIDYEYGIIRAAREGAG